MLNKLTALIHLSDEHSWTPIMGSMPHDDNLAALREMAQQRPAARKFAGGMAVTVPLDNGGWHFWLISEVLGVTELSGVMTRLQDLSKGISNHGPVSSPAMPLKASADSSADLIAKVSARTNGTRKIKPKTMALMLLDSLIELGKVESGAIFSWSGRGKLKVWPSDERLYGKSDELTAIFRAMQGDEPLQKRIAEDGPDDDAIELTIMTRNLEGKAAVAVLPPRGKAGYGIIAFGNQSLNTANVATAIDVLHLKFPFSGRDGTTMRTLRRVAVIAAIGGFGYFLAQPAPTILNTVGTTVAADVTAVTLPSDAYLTQMHVRVGDEVAPGDIIGEFTSRAIDDALAEERLSAAVEQLSAQAALAENNYGAFQLANQRLEIIQARIAQLSQRQAELTVTAPVEGHVISAMSNSVSGLFGQTGQEVALLQTSDAMQVQIELSRMDARLVTPDMAGTAYFRGLSQRLFDVEVVLQPAAFTHRETGRSTIETKASVAAPDGLIVGMTGFVRLNGPQAPRYVSFSRYVAEFVREKLWTYLGLHL